ncbi:MULTISPECIES: ABC transporter permease [unclassified Mesorhizobium]|uniref:ABC transporter permease n=1 Tax=unclassified Mesorhizobium TaxID=325217 RepID=UPI001AED2F5D|nr:MULTISPECIES: ABC transporter permease [unclassified Mesorhizobium]
MTSNVLTSPQRRKRPRRLPDAGMGFGVVLVGFVLALVLLGPWLAPHTSTALLAAPFEQPSGELWFGADFLGRDVLSRTLWGGQTVLGLSLTATVLALVAGVAVGLAAGASNSWVSDVIMAAMDLILAFPQIVLVVLFVSMLGPQLWLITLVTAISHAPRIARVTRGLTAELMQHEFIQAAQVIGTPSRVVLTREVLPSLLTPLAVEFTTRLTWSVGLISGLSFIGFGLQPPQADWGLMLNENRNGLLIQPWAVVLPAFMIAVLTIGAGLIADSLARRASGSGQQGR